MKRVEAFIKPHRLNKVVSALHALPSFPGFSVLSLHGQGHGRGAGGHYAYGEGTLLLHESCLLVIVCEDQDAEHVAAAILQSAYTGRQGDGIVLISEVTQLLRIRDAGASV